MTGPLPLVVSDLVAGYGGAPALDGASLEVRPGEVVALLGPNGAGKSTLARALLGRLRRVSGSIALHGEEVRGLPTHVLMRKGIALVPEGRMLIKDLSTEDNLRLGAIARRWRGASPEDLDFIYEQFPRLKERRNLSAGVLSGGEQQMAAIGRALALRPSVLILDEPSLGLAPMIVEGLFTAIRRLADMGTAVLVAEQNVRAAMGIADRAYVLAAGQVVRSGSAEEIQSSSDLLEIYLGTAREPSATP